MWPRGSLPRSARRTDLAKVPWLLPQEEFQRIVHRERARADRNSQAFTVVVFDAAGTTVAVLRTVLETLKERRRLTDDIGWWAEPSEVGVLLADTPASGAFNYCTAIHERLRAAGVEVGSCIYAYQGAGLDLDLVSSGTSGGRRASDRGGPSGRRAEDSEGEHLPALVRGGDDAAEPSPAEPEPPLAASAADVTPPEGTALRDMRELFIEPLPRWKRALDVFGAAAALLIFSPLFLLIGLAVKLSAPRAPIIFKQPRAGLGGKPFMFYKFRTMVPNAEALKDALRAKNEVSGPVFKMAHDPRVTRLGRFLRRTSLDEIPQIWNVLRGDMSLVGPRPPTLDEVPKYEAWQRRRLYITGGITGFWQVSGRHEIGFVDWMRLDLRYAASRSLWTDLKVLFKTVGAVLNGRGAS